MRRLLPILAVLCLGACQAKTVVDIDAAGDGTGVVAVEVRLDEEAAAAVPDLQDRLRTDDLERSGWEVEPVRKDGAETVIRATHGFEGERQANAVLTQLAAGDSPFRDFRIEQQRSFTGVDTSFSGTVDLTHGIDSFGDATLQQRFGSPLGFDSASAGVDWAQSVPVTVRFSAPGSVRGQLPPDDDAEWNIPYGEATALAATYSGANYRPMGLAALAIVATLAAVVILFLTRSGKYTPKHSAKSGGVRARDLLASGA